MRYKNIDKNKANGIVYTPKDMSDFLADEMIRYKNIDGKIRILDPAIGNGQLVISLINKLSSKISYEKIQVIGYETEEKVANEVCLKLKKEFKGIEVEIKNNDFITSYLNNIGFEEKFDFIIANPPYLRTQILGKEKAQEISKKLKLTGRIDIYYAFLLIAKELLKEEGIAGFITSNKILSVKSGESIRKYLYENTEIIEIVDFGDTKLFDAAVLPLIMIFKPGRTIEEKVHFTSIYETNDKSFKEVNRLFDYLKQNVNIKVNNRIFKVNNGKLCRYEEKKPWCLISSDTKEWLESIEKITWKKFEDIGKIKVGIKTTADNVFIKEEWESNDEKPELIKKLITHRNAGQIISNNKKMWEVIYPYTFRDNKKICYDIEDFPKTKEYLLRHYEQLSSREYLKKSNRKWFELWVPQNPSLWEKNKIVFRDITEHPQFWIDKTGAVVNGDCYWIDINPNVDEDTVYLALAIANSNFIERYYDLKFNNKLYNNKRRFMAQYVNEFPIPNPQNVYSKKIIEIVKNICEKNPDENEKKIEMSEINNLIEKIIKA